MSWARIDDKSTWHRKVTKAGNRAWGALVRMITHCKDLGTDGRVTAEVARAIQEADEIDRLLAVGLLDADGSDYLVHDFLHWNESARQAEKVRKSRSKAGRASAQQRSNRLVNTCSNTTSTNGVGVGVGVGVGADPDPRSEDGCLTPRDPVKLELQPSAPAKPPKRGHATKATRIAADWEPPPDFWDWVRAEGYSESAVRAEVPDFRDYWLARDDDAERADWTAVLRGRIRREAKDGRIRQRSPATLRLPDPPPPEPGPEIRAKARALLADLVAAKLPAAPAAPPISELRRRAGWVEPDCEVAP